MAEPSSDMHVHTQSALHTLTLMHDHSVSCKPGKHLRGYSAALTRPSMSTASLKRCSFCASVGMSCTSSLVTCVAARLMSVVPYTAYLLQR